MAILDEGMGGFQSKPKAKAKSSGNVRFGSFVDDTGRMPVIPQKKQRYVAPPRPPGGPTRVSGGMVGPGAGGGGGGATAPSAPANPLAGLDLDEISAALEAISGMFNLERGNLTSEQESALTAFEFLRDSITTAQTQAVDEARSAASGRGLLRSGLYLNTTGEIAQEASERLAQATAQKVERERAIQQRIAGLKSQEKLDRAERARQLAREQVGTKEAIAAALKLA